MRLLFDQNLSPRLVGQLANVFPNSLHVRNVGMASSPDSDVWNFAATNGLTIVSKDMDFQQRAILYGHPPKVIWLRVGNCSSATIASLLDARVVEIEDFEVDPNVSFLTLS